MKKVNRREAPGKSMITSNMEDYLEAIHEIEEERSTPGVRVTDLARRLGVTRPSVVGMLRHLSEHNLVVHGHYGRVELTAEGLKIAVEMAHRHRVLRRFLEEVLGLDAEIAEEDACRMEHTLSPETIDRFIAYEDFRESSIEQHKQGSERFRKFLRGRKSMPQSLGQRAKAIE